MSAAPADIILSSYGLSKEFPIRGGFFQRQIAAVQALRAVNLRAPRGRILSLVGESGCGKTSLGRVISGLYKATSGAILFDAPRAVSEEFTRLWTGTPQEQRTKEQTQRILALRKTYDLHLLSKSELNQKRREIQMVFQDPYASLNPRFTVKNIVGEGLRIHRVFANKKEELELVQELLERTGIDPSLINRYPHEFSGGQRQRLGIARVLALHPKFVILDEPVSALDVSVQIQILDLFKELKQEFDLSYIFIAHDLSVVDYFTDDIAVMYLGSIVEQGHKSQVNTRPQHPYTQALISAVPIRDPARRQQRIILKGEIPSPRNIPRGCPFHTRCPKLMPKCREQSPELKELDPGHFVACHLY